MGFFSKKTPKTLKNDPSELIDAKIHIMQHDLDEIAHVGRVEIEADPQKTKKSKEVDEASSTPIPSDSPFSQSIYPASNEPLPETTPEAETPSAPKSLEPPAPPTIPEPTPPAPKPLPETPVDMGRGPSAITSTPLNLPTFEATPAPTYQSRPLPSARPTPAPITPDPKPSPATSPQPAAIRTGAWPVPLGSPDTDKKLPSKSSASKKKTSTKKSPPDKNALPENIILKEGWGWKHTVILGLVIAALSGGGYYFWATRYPESMPELPHPNIPDISSNPKADEILNEPEEELPFSITTPNTFVIDVETETVSMLREKLFANAETMKEASMTGPIPFTVVDKTNTPIAFFIFASIFNLGLSGDLLNSLNNDFTLSLVIDQNEPRLVFTLGVKDAKNAAQYLAASEKTLPISLKNILLVETPPAVPASTFSASTYRTANIRYFNFPGELALSLDYTIVNETLIIGTSKNATHSEIDMLLDTAEETSVSKNGLDAQK